MILSLVPHKRRLTYLMAKYVKAVRQTLNEICHTSSQDPGGPRKSAHHTSPLFSHLWCWSASQGAWQIHMNTRAFPPNLLPQPPQSGPSSIHPSKLGCTYQHSAGRQDQGRDPRRRWKWTQGLWGIKFLDCSVTLKVHRFQVVPRTPGPIGRSTAWEGPQWDPLKGRVQSRGPS